VIERCLDVWILVCEAMIAATIAVYLFTLRSPE